MCAFSPDQAMMRFSEFHPRIRLFSRVQKSWILVIGIYMMCVNCLPLNHLGQPLFDNDTLWLNPCNVHSYNESTTNISKTFTPAQLLGNLDRIKSSIIRTIQEIDQIASQSGKDTDWNTSQNRKKYTFLKSYKKNQTTWEPRIQVYLASIQVIYQKQVYLENARNLYKHQSPKLQELRQNAKGLLCEIQEYRNRSKNGIEHHRGPNISVQEMNSIINFDMTEEANMELHKWFLKCRFRCFLEDMEKHVSNLMGKFSKTRPTRKVRTTKKPIKRSRKGQNNKKNERPLKNKCCIVNNKPTSLATPKTPLLIITRKPKNNKKKLGIGQKPKLIKPNLKKVQRKSNKKSGQ